MPSGEDVPAEEETMTMEDAGYTDTNPQFSGSLPVIASIIYGMIAAVEAALPVVLMYTVKNLSAVDRNDIYRWAWYFMAWGGVGVYGPITILWPLSYAGLGSVYVTVADILGWVGLILHFSVTFMLGYANSNYYKESSLDYWEIYVEELVYNVSIYIVFYMTKRALMPDYYHFYST